MVQASEAPSGGELGVSNTTLAKSDVLWAASKLIGTQCADENLAFYRCKKADADPAKCLEPGKDVTSCVSGVLRDVEARCSSPFEAYRKCLRGNRGEFGECRAAQKTLEECYKK